MSIRKVAKSQIDASIANQSQPRVPKNGIGLVLPDGKRRKMLVNGAGALTPASTYYFAQTGTTPPRAFDFKQEPVRKGRSLMIKLLDGSMKAVSRFDNVAKEFKPTAAGKQFFKNRRTAYTVLFPISVDLTRTNGSIFVREGDYMPSTATSLGQIEVSAALTEAEQIADVKRQALAWVGEQPLIEGERILLPGYETHRMDSSRQMQFNRLSFNAQGEASAVMHRPLLAGAPWMFDFPGVCEEAAHDTNDQCVAYQLSKYIRIKGGEQPFTREQLARELVQASLELYEGDPENEDVLECPGFTAAAVKVVCASYGIPLHLK